MERALTGRGCTGSLEADGNTVEQRTGHQNPTFNSLIVKEPETFMKKKQIWERRPESSVAIETGKKKEKRKVFTKKNNLLSTVPKKQDKAKAGFE